MTTKKWYRDDEENKKEGWAVFECDCGESHIQKLDDPANCEPYPGFDDPKFEADEDVIQFVRAKAASASARHIRALSLHQEPKH